MPLITLLLIKLVSVPEGKLVKLSCSRLYILTDPPLVPIHNLPDLSSYRQSISFACKLFGSSGLLRYTVNAVPSNLLSPSSVANHIRPYLSLRMALTVFEDKPFF